MNLENSVKAGKKRVTDIDGIISRLYEDNINDKISDERYVKMAAGHEMEQKTLSETVEADEKRLDELQKSTVDLRLLSKTLRGCTDIAELNRMLANKLV